MLIKKNILSRIVIYPKDVELITGRKGRTAQLLLQNIRKSLGKEKHQFITIPEFCAYTGMDENKVKELIAA